MTRALKALVLSLAVSLSIIGVAGNTWADSKGHARVIDGDTLEIDATTYRLFGIDAPEAGQRCLKSGGGNWPCGKAAIAAMEDLVSEQIVQCDNHGFDPYDRVLGICTVDGVVVNEAMVRDGLAWSFRKYSHEYDQLEDNARTRKVGVWQASTQTPWDYRAARWTVAQHEAPNGCPIKGNISENGHIYHAPWSPWYSRTSIDLSKGERWFCDEAEALAAGWRAPRWGR